ncbi:MAG: molecular chaperone HtpG [Candidatus Omnitrophota bacterium]
MADRENVTETHEYKAEIRQLLDIIIHSLYTHPEVFLRELISNASDALNKIRFRKLTDKDVADYDAPLEIRIEVDPKKHLFSIEDTGIGMTRDDLINNIGTIARSGTLEFMKTVKDGNKTFDDELIGKFGVGFYSVFMVTNEVTIETRYADRDSKGYLWKSSGTGAYTIAETDRKKRGTRISFMLKENAQEFSMEYRVKEIVNRYSNFADFPIFLKNEKINVVSALWHRKKDEVTDAELTEFYKFLTNENEAPLSHLQLAIEGAANFKALLFIPSSAPPDLVRVQLEKSIHLYSNKILIQADAKDLLHDYLRFVKGVVDTTDLPLNVSREVTQASPAVSKIKGMLTREILAWLKDMSGKEADKFGKFYKNFGSLFKIGINTDFENREKIIDLCMYESSVTGKGELTTLKSYVSRMKKEQKAIYYISGDSRDVLDKNPNLEYFRKKGIEVLLLTEPVDVFTVPSIGEYDKKPLKSVEKSDIDLMPEDRIEKPGDTLSKELLKRFKETLKDRVEDVVASKRLVDSPVTLVTGKYGVDPQMEKMMKIMNLAGGVPEMKKIMEVNVSHPLVTNLARIYMGNSSDPLIDKCITQLYEGALFIEGSLPPSSDFIRRMTEIMETATGKA